VGFGVARLVVCDFASVSSTRLKGSYIKRSRRERRWRRRYGSSKRWKGSVEIERGSRSVDAFLMWEPFGDERRCDTRSRIHPGAREDWRES